MSAVPAITVKQLKAGMDAHDGVTIIDVREPDEYEICRIEGSTLIPLSVLPERTNEIPKEGLVVLHCHHGRRSEQAAHYLMQQGHTNVVNLTGGIHAWTMEIDPTVTAY